MGPLQHEVQHSCLSTGRLPTPVLAAQGGCEGLGGEQLSLECPNEGRQHPRVTVRELRLQRCLWWKGISVILGYQTRVS